MKYDNTVINIHHSNKECHGCHKQIEIDVDTHVSRCQVASRSCMRMFTKNPLIKHFHKSGSMRDLRRSGQYTVETANRDRSNKLSAWSVQDVDVNRWRYIQLVHTVDVSMQSQFVDQWGGLIQFAAGHATDTYLQNFIDQRGVGGHTPMPGTVGQG